MNRRIASGGGWMSARAAAAAAVVVEALERRALMSTAGALDPTFGDGGVVRLDTVEEVPVVTRAGALQADGKAILAGTSRGLNGGDSFVAVARLTVAGETDASFGNGGVVELVDAGYVRFNVVGVGVQADGRIIVAGTVQDAEYNGYLAVTRLMPDGSVDASFGTQGWTTVPFGARCDVRAMALGADGDVYVAGSDGQARPAFAAARLTAAGAVDDSFARHGYAVVRVPGVGRAGAEVDALAVADDGSVTLAGGDKVEAVARLTSAGRLDTSFATGGTLAVAGGAGAFSAVALRPDDGVVLGAARGGALTLTTLTASGQPDRSFGSAGSTSETAATGKRGSSSASLAAIDVTGSGEIVVAGAVVGRQVSGPLVARFNADGSPDATFGDGGVSVFATRAAWNNQYEEPLTAGGLLLAEDGSAVVPFDGAPSARVKRAVPHLRAVRFGAGGGVDATYDTAGVAATAQGENFVYSVTPLADGSIWASTYTAAAGAVTRTYAADGTRGPDQPSSGFASLARDAQGRYLSGFGDSVVRYAADGTRDTTFGTNGVVTLNIPLFNGIGRIWARADGSILVLGGYTTDGLPEGSRLFVLDASGHVTATLAADIGYDVNPGSLITDAVVTPDGKILVAYNDFQDSNAQATLIGSHVARFNADLTPDTSFGTNGVTQLSGIPVGGSQFEGFGVQPRGLVSITVAPDGHVYAVGLPTSQGQSAVLARLAPNGAIDNGFGTGGYRTDLPVLGTIFVEPDGRLIAAAGEDGAIKVALYDVNGNLDTTFGNAGVSTFSFVANARATQSPVHFALGDVNGEEKLYAAGSSLLTSRPSDAAGGAYEGFIARIDA